MEKHILIVLLDEQKFTSSEPNTIEVIKSTLENTIIHKELEIYFFKILSADPHQKIDTLSRIQSLDGHENIFIEYEEKFYFRDGKDLKKGFELVKNNRNNNDLKWYFVSVGHGSGHSIFDLNKFYRTFLNNNLINNEEANLINVELPDKNLYISEIVQAASDLGNFPFRLGLFYNCDLTLLDNCFLLAKKFKYFIGTENYNSNKFILLDGFIDMLNKRIDENWDSYYFVTSFFEIQKQKIDDLLTRFPATLGNLKGTSLFAINLQYLNNIFDYFDILSKELLKLIDVVSYQEKYKKIRQKELKPSDTVFVDLFNFIDELKKGSVSNTIILKQISLINGKKEKTIIGSYVNLNNIIKIDNLQGLSIYIPFMGQSNSAYYIRIREQVIKFPQHNWYLFIDKIIELFKSTS